MNRKGVTLLEILLVVAVIAVLAAVAVPLWNVMLQSEKVSRGADILRAELGATRVLSIREGEEYVFCYVPESGQFWSEPLSASTSLVSPLMGEEPSDKLSLPPANYLPEGVFFSIDSQVGETIRSQNTEEESGSSTQARRIIFYPDGSSQSAGIVIRNEYGDGIQVSLRGITGGSAASGWLELEN